MNKKLKITLLVATMLFLPSTMTAKSMPSKMSYQGRLVDRNNVPVSGTVDLVFSLFDALSGGNQIWTESQSAVPVIRGVFNVQLGSITTLPSAIFTNSLWLDVTVNGGAPLAPRRPLLSSPYSFAAGIAYSMTNNSITSNMIKPQNITSSNIKNDTIRNLDLASDTNSLKKVSGGLLSATNKTVTLGTNGSVDTFNIKALNGIALQPDDIWSSGDVSQIWLGPAFSGTYIQNAFGAPFLLNSDNEIKIKTAWQYINAIAPNGIKILPQSETWNSGDVARLSFGDTNTGIKAINNTGLRFSAINAKNQMVLMENTGNVGIGTNNPVTKLQVVGNMIVETNLDVKGNIFIGTNELNKTNKLLIYGDKPGLKIDLSVNAEPSKWIGLSPDWRQAYSSDSGFRWYNSWNQGKTWGTPIMDLDSGGFLMFPDEQKHRISLGGTTAGKAKWIGIDGDWNQAYTTDGAFAWYKSNGTASWGSNIMQLDNTGLLIKPKTDWAQGDIAKICLGNTSTSIQNNYAGAFTLQSDNPFAVLFNTSTNLFVTTDGYTIAQNMVSFLKLIGYQNWGSFDTGGSWWEVNQEIRFVIDPRDFAPGGACQYKLAFNLRNKTGVIMDYRVYDITASSTVVEKDNCFATANGQMSAWTDYTANQQSVFKVEVRTMSGSATFELDNMYLYIRPKPKR